MAVLQSLLGSIASAAKLDGYAATVEALPGGPPLAHWRLGEAGGTEIRDRKGVRHGTYSGTIGYDAPALPQNSNNGAINFAATGTGTVPHDQGLALSAFSLSFWFRLNALPDDNVVWFLLNKEQSGVIDGDFLIRVDDLGILDAQFQSDSAVQRVTTEVEPDTSYHLCVRADSTGFDAYLNGEYLGKNTNFTDAWASNTNALRFAIAPFSVEPADVVLDEVTLYDRVLTEAEVITLAQVIDPPVAIDDVVAVLESAMTPVAVLDNDSYVGTPSLSIVTQPGGGDSVAVNGTVINYTAGAVPADTMRSFLYRITDPNGQSNTATVTVTVLNADATAPSQANCYTENTDDVVVVNSMAALQTAINTAPPGRTILIAPPAGGGAYAGGTLTFNPQGTAANPIVVRPQNGPGTVTINDAVWTLAPASSRVVFSKLQFNGSRIVLQGNNHRVTRCQFRQVNSYCVVVNVGFDHRIDHCDCSDWLDSSNTKGFVDIPNGFATGGFSGILFDYNYIHDINHPTGRNACSIVDTNSGGGSWATNTGIVIDHNLVENCPAWPDAEFITIKHSGAIIRHNTFHNLTGVYLQQRQGGGWEVRSNWFEAVGSNFLHGFNDTGAGHGPQLIIGNRFIGNINMWVAAGNSATAGPAFYHASMAGQIIGNRMGTGRILVGGYWDNTAVVPAQNNNLFENIRDAGGDAHQLVAGQNAGTTFNDPGGDPKFDYTPAVKLTSSDVGLAAPDPLCPSGPQS